MSKDCEYLSDKELDSLIESIEAEGLVSAPDDFAEVVLGSIEDIDKYKARKASSELTVENRKLETVPDRRKDNRLGSRSDNRSDSRKILDYSIYCMKVFGSIAAAILIMVMVPFIKGAERVPDRAEVVSQTIVPTKEDVVSQRPVRSKEEVLNKQTENTDLLTDLETWFDSLPISK